MKNKFSQIVFIFGIMFVLALGFVTSIVSGKEINKYENRYAEKYESFSIDGYMTLSFQDSVEKTLSDKVNFAESMKKLYNDTKGKTIKAMVDTNNHIFALDDKIRYVKIGSRNLMGDYVVLNYSVFEDLKWKLIERAADYNKIKERNPNTDFYFYYIEKDTDVNFETGEKVGVFEFMQENLNFDKDKMARYEISDFETFKRCFFKTDHHWNNFGAHRGYVEVLNLLDKTQTPLVPGEEVKISSKYRGSKATGLTAGFFEDFNVYKYNLPKVKVLIHAWEQDSYSRREEFIKSRDEKVTYADFYGLDVGVVEFYANKGTDNVLIVGESYDNAVLDLLSGHFNSLHSVDLRYYEVYMKEKFDIDKYIKEHNITKVLFMGNVDYLILDVFKPEA